MAALPRMGKRGSVIQLSPLGEFLLHGTPAETARVSRLASELRGRERVVRDNDIGLPFQFQHQRNVIGLAGLAGKLLLAGISLL